MSADDVPQVPSEQPSEHPPFDAADFGGDAEPRATPDHVEPYASHDDDVPSRRPDATPDHVDPYSSRD